MARKLRVEYPGPIHHLIDHGDRREPTFRADVDRQIFIATPAEARRAPTGWKRRSAF
jgi:hypothetical protein